MENNTKETPKNDSHAVEDNAVSLDTTSMKPKTTKAMDIVDSNVERAPNDEPDPRTFFWPYRSTTKEQQTARMPVEKDAMYYNMEHRHRGIAIILNHEQFEVHKLKARNGTHVDKKYLELVLDKLGFDVWTYTDLNFEEVEKVIAKAAAYDHKDNDCFFMAVLSHGEQGILFAKDAPYDPQLLWTPFTGDKCPSLAGKPKLFFIQACQGDSFDAGIELMSRTETDSSMSYRIPTHADFLIAYSTVPGYFSWRNTTKGSWFMQALCEELERYAFQWDLMTVLTSVLRRVAIEYESNVPDNHLMHKQKQMPYITTMLTRLVSFKPKKKLIK